MPRYYFHVRDGRLDRDEVGTELATWEDAVQHAVEVAGSVLKDQIRATDFGPEWFVEVTNENDLTLFRINLEVLLAPVLMHSAATKGKLR